MIDGVEKNGHGELDLGADRDSHKRPCTRRTWCVLEEDHDGSCVELPRAPHERPDWDRKVKDPIGWRKK